MMPKSTEAFDEAASRQALSGATFSDYLHEQRLKIDEALSRWFAAGDEKVLQAVRYSLLLPSKRLRPIFCLETCRGFLGSDARALPAAMALEMVHTYSLVHDDLPAMDNDDLRRGKPTNHKVFGDAHAILAGDALLTSAFEVLGKAGSSETSAKARIDWVVELSEAAGIAGMVLGQALDMEASGRTAAVEELESLHRKKTGALLAASVVMGGIAAGVDQSILNGLRAFALDMGLAFQIQDDVLDVIGGEEIGKPTRSDERNVKATYVSLLGLEGAKAQAKKWSDNAMRHLSGISFPYGNRLEELTRFVIERRV